MRLALHLLVIFLLLVPLCRADASDPYSICTSKHTFMECIEDESDIQCKMVQHHGRCECMPLTANTLKYEACLGDEPDDDSTTTQNQILIASIVAVTLLLCLCCICFVFLQPLPLGTKMSVETQPLIAPEHHYVTGVPSAPMHMNPVYQPAQPAMVPTVDPAYYQAPVAQYPTQGPVTGTIGY